MTRPLTKLPDDDMLRIMARENMEEWGTSVWVEMETVKSAVEAYAEGRISLPEVPEKTNRRHVRHAPSFLMGGAGPDEGQHPYTAATLARFLGWTKESRGRVRENAAVEIALSALEMVEAGVTPEFVDYEGDSPISYVISKNARRRHMTKAQLALAVREMKEDLQREARERVKKGAEEGGYRSHSNEPPAQQAPGPEEPHESGRWRDKAGEAAGMAGRPAIMS